MYTEKQIQDLDDEEHQYFLKCVELETRIIDISSKMSERAKDHALYGVARRLQLLRNCLRFFFEAIPPDLDSGLDLDIRAQGDAHLHAYLINCCGIFDNMASSLAYHIQLDKQIDLEKEKHSIDLFKKKFEIYLPNKLAIRVKEFDKWHEFLVNQRHPTAHRIPPYIVPSLHYQDTSRIDYTPYYTHSFDKGQLIPLHPQSISDMGAVVLIVESWLNSL